MSTTIFREVLGNTPRIRVMDFLIENRRDSWNLREISNDTNSSYATVKTLIPKLVKKRLVKVDKKMGKIKFYKINESNPAIVRLVQFDWELVKDFVKHELP